MTPGEGPFLTPRGSIYIKLHIKMLHTKYRIFGSCGFREDDFVHVFFFHYKPMADNYAPGAWPTRTQVARLAGFIKRTTIRCYTHHMKALGIVASEKKIALCFPIVRL